MAKSPEEMAQAMIGNLEEKTGKTLEEWLPITKASGLEKHGQIVKFLKSEHGVTHGFANLIAHKSLEAAQGAPTGETDLVSAQYSGGKAGLKPIYDALVEAVSGFGSDVELAPKKSYVSLRRKKQFGLIQPSTKTRVDVGIQLKDHPTSDRLEASGSFNAMVSHRVRVTAPDQVDDALIDWLKEAYQAAG